MGRPPRRAVAAFAVPSQSGKSTPRSAAFFATSSGKLFFIRNRQYADSLMASPTGRLLHAFWLSDWGLDWLYDRVFVRPVVWMATINRRDAVDSVFSAIAWINRSAHYALSRTQTGSLRWYAAVVGAGAVIFAGVILLT